MQLRNVRRDNRGRLFRKFDGMRSPRESENDTPPEQGETFYRLFVPNEEGRKSESLRKLASYSREKLYNARVIVSQGIGNMCAHLLDKEPL